MAFRFNNPLKRIANTNAAINRGPGQFGQVSSSIAKFNDIQKNIGRISSGIGQISGNKNNLFDVITNALGSSTAALADSTEAEQF